MLLDTRPRCKLCNKKAWEGYRRIVVKGVHRGIICKECQRIDWITRLAEQDE